MEFSDRSTSRRLCKPKKNHFRRGSFAMQKSASQNTYRPCSKEVGPVKRVWNKVPKRIYSQEQILALQSHTLSKQLTSVNPKFLNRKMLALSKKHRSQSERTKIVNENFDALERNCKSLLNKLAPTNFESISGKLLEILVPATSFKISCLVLEKASLEPKYSETYASLCQEAIRKCPFFREDLLSACQEFFEGVLENPDSLSSQKKKIMGSVRFIGELFNRRMIPSKVLKLICNDLLSIEREECAEGVCYLLSTCKWVFEHKHFKEESHRWLKLLQEMSQSFSSRVKFQVLDLVENQEMKYVNFQKQEAPQVLQRKRKLSTRIA